MIWEVSLILSNDNPLSGSHIKSRNFDIFFGENLATLEKIQSQYSTVGVHQVHGNRVVEARKTYIKADGHFTDKKSLALIIKTADCMPVFLNNGPRIFALHIGWRGLMQKILTESKSYWLKSYPVDMWIGPHIKQKHFELDIVSASQLIAPHKIGLENATKLGIFKLSPNQKNHFRVNLKEILKKEAKGLGIQSINDFGIDTFSSYKHNSHRRNRFNKNRNYSFIIKK